MLWCLGLKHGTNLIRLKKANLINLFFPDKILGFLIFGMYENEGRKKVGKALNCESFDSNYIYTIVYLNVKKVTRSKYYDSKLQKNLVHIKHCRYIALSDDINNKAK